MSKGLKIVLAFVGLLTVFCIAGIISAKTYDYTDDPLLHKAYEGYDDALPIDTPSYEAEFDTGKYTAVSASDDSWAVSHQDDSYDFHKFDFKIDEDVSTIGQIYVLHEGYGSKISGPGHSLFIWNYTASVWDLVNNTSVGDGDQLLVGTFTSGFSDYIKDGSLSLLAETNQESSCPFLI